MKYTFTEQTLFLLADWFDFNQRFLSWKMVLAIRGDPRLRRHRRWLEKHLENKKRRKKLYDTIQAFKKREYLREEIFGNSQGYILTPKGKLRILRAKVKEIKKKKLPKGQYLMVFFDIPEKIRKIRDIFRLSLKELGFEQLQKSVWVTSYETSRELKELIKDCNLEKYAKPLFIRELKK